MSRGKHVTVEPHHALNGFLHLSDCEFKDQADALLILTVLGLDLLQQLVGFGPIAAFFDAALAAKLAVLVDDPQTYNFVPIINELIYKPFQGKLGIVVLISAAQEGAGPLRVAIVLMLRSQSKGKVNGILVVECVE